MKERKCPRCNGTGKEWYGRMICATCHGTGKISEPVCSHCNHLMSYHTKYPNMGIMSCDAESASGQFICGCQGSDKTAKPICNVCGKDWGNSYCLENHLEESEKCRKEFKITYYGD